MGGRRVPKSQTSAHLDAVAAQSIRKIYGYVGHIRRLSTSRNTYSPFLLTVVSKLCFDDAKDFNDLSNLSVTFVKIGAFSPNWTPMARNPEPSNSTSGCFIEGIVLAPSSEKYRCGNLARWRLARMKERKRRSRHTQFLPGQVHLDPNTVSRLPTIGSSNVPPYATRWIMYLPVPPHHHHHHA